MFERSRFHETKHMKEIKALPCKLVCHPHCYGWRPMEGSGNSSRSPLARFGHLGLDCSAHQTVQSFPSATQTNMRAEAGSDRRWQEYEVSAPSFTSGMEAGQGTALPAPTFKNTACPDYVSQSPCALRNFQNKITRLSVHRWQPTMLIVKSVCN